MPRRCFCSQLRSELFRAHKWQGPASVEPFAAGVYICGRDSMFQRCGKIVDCRLSIGMPVIAAPCLEAMRSRLAIAFAVITPTLMAASDPSKGSCEWQRWTAPRRLDSLSHSVDAMSSCLRKMHQFACLCISGCLLRMWKHLQRAVCCLPACC